MRDHPFPRCLVMIDASDECKEEKATPTVPSPLAVFTVRGRLSPVRSFITSRPVQIVEVGVGWGFHPTGLMKDTNTLVRHNIPLDISQKGYSHLSHKEALGYRAVARLGVLAGGQGNSPTGPLDVAQQAVLI